MEARGSTHLSPPRNVKLPKRTYDFILYGATSPPGRQLAAYLAQNLSRSMATTWAYAATSEDELDEIDELLFRFSVRTVIDQILVVPKISREPFHPILMAPSEFEPPDVPWMLDQLTSQTFVLVNCCEGVQQSELLLQSCLKTRSHYVDVVPDRAFLSTVERNYAWDAGQQNLVLLLGCCWERVCEDAAVMAQWKEMTDHLPARDLVQVESADAYISTDAPTPNAPLQWRFLNALRGAPQASSLRTVAKKTERASEVLFYPGYPSYDASEYQYALRLHSPGSVHRIMADEVCLTYGSTRSLFTQEWYRGFVMWIQLCIFLFLCKYFLLFPLFKWLFHHRAKEYSYYDYHDLLVHCQLAIDPRIAQIEHAELVPWRRKLQWPESSPIAQVRRVLTACHVQGSAQSIGSASILACLLCLLHQKENRPRGLIAPGELGLPLLKNLRQLGIEFEVSLREDGEMAHPKERSPARVDSPTFLSDSDSDDALSRL